MIKCMNKYNYFWGLMLVSKRCKQEVNIFREQNFGLVDNINLGNPDRLSIQLIFFKFLLLMGGQKPEQYRFIYNGVEYDASSYVFKHPGGKDFIDNMKAQRKDFTEYFKCLHSEEAQKILKSFPIVANHEQSKDAQQYYDILHKVEHLYKIRWDIEILLMTLVAATFLTACFTNIWIVSILGFALTQLIVGWMGHSMVHSRDKTLNFIGRVFAAWTGGFSLQWWSPKHNMHHIFTNSQLYDDDIKHEYKVYLYPFLYFKWRFDSLMTAFKTKNVLDICNILINYMLVFYCRKNIMYFVLGELLAGFFSAFVLVGNHEREKRYNQKIKASFIDHQIQTCRNYRQSNIFWLMLMGGMQFQTEHHMFPQIPFYNLPKSVPIIREELKKLNKSIIYGPVL